MALIVEDGTGLNNADSYISLADARIFASDYGYTLPADDTEAGVFLRKGALYVDLSESSFTGSRLVDTQALAWPRSDAYKCSGRNQIALPSNSVPIEIKNSQVISASYYASGLNPRAASTGLRIQSEELTGVGKTSYFDSGGSSSTVEITEANDMIANLMCSNAESGLSIPTLRI